LATNRKIFASVNLWLLAKIIVKKVIGNQRENICECKPIAIGKNNCEKSNWQPMGKYLQV